MSPIQGSDSDSQVDCGVFALMAMTRMYAGRELDYRQGQVRQRTGQQSGTGQQAVQGLVYGGVRRSDMEARYPEPLQLCGCKRGRHDSAF